MVLFLRVGILAAAVALAGCGASSEAPERVKALVSWAATGQMLTEAWIGGAAPRSYSLRALDGLRKAVEAEARRARRAGVPRAAADHAVERLDRAMAAARLAIARADRDAAGAASHQLRREGAELQQLAERLRTDS